jgi:hypothetical protein
VCKCSRDCYRLNNIRSRLAVRRCGGADWPSRTEQRHVEIQHGRRRAGKRIILFTQPSLRRCTLRGVYVQTDASCSPVPAGRHRTVCLAHSNNRDPVLREISARDFARLTVSLQTMRPIFSEGRKEGSCFSLVCVKGNKTLVLLMPLRSLDDPRTLGPWDPGLIDCTDVKARRIILLFGFSKCKQHKLSRNASVDGSSEP